MTNNILYYFGDDKVFFTGLKAIIETNTNNTIQLKKFFASQESTIQSLFSEVALHKPDAVLIDFSLYPEDYLHLARILSRTPFDKKIPVIGILDHLKTNHVLVEAQTTGISLCFIKSEHSKDIAESLLRLIYPGKLSASNYVKVRVNEHWTAGLVSKIGYVYENGLHFETNLELRPGDVIDLEHFWRNKSLIPSKEVTIRKVEQRNLAYNYSYAVDAEFEFVDIIKTPEKTPADEVKRYNLIENVKYRFRKVFDKTFSTSSAKRAKVLILDSAFSIYTDSKRSDRYPFMLRCLGSNLNLETELEKLTPHIIVLSLDDIIREKSVEMVAEWSKKQKFTPYLIIFNSEEAVSEWQKRLDYKNILASSGEMNTEILLKMAQIFDSKIQTIEMKNEKKMFISKHKEESNCEIEIDIRADYLSESDMTFTSKMRIPIGSNLCFKEPIKSLAYVYQEKSDGGLYQYSALLHSHDELEKNSIRRFINTVLFRENEMKVADKKALMTQEIKLKEILKNSHLKNED